MIQPLPVHPAGLSPPAALLLASYRERRQRERRERRERVGARVQVQLDPSLIRDPPLGDRGAKSRLGHGALWLLASAVVHGAVATVGAAVTWSGGPPDARAFQQAVQVRMIEPPPAPKPVEMPPVPALPPPAPVKQVKVAARQLVPPIAPPPEVAAPPDPTNIDAPSPPVLSPTRARRVVGLSLESTVVGGQGTAFAVGNTRMGSTPIVSEAPETIEELTPEFTPPVRRTAEKPDYPAALRAAGIEGDVGLEIEIDATGQVTRVTAVRPSAHEAFNEAALAAAQRSQYQPAKVNGVPVAHTLRFTVRFRIRE